MDPLTHGLTGALLGKAFFADGRDPGTESPTLGRAAVLAATLGAVFPDVDVIAGWLTGNDLAILEVHRGVTHSFVGLPVFAVILASLSRAYARRRRLKSPSWSALALIYAVGLASHVLLDLITSFGTMIWNPWNRTRASWDLVFIIDFAMTGIVLLPQTAAWVYRQRSRHRSRAVRLWGLFTACAVLIERLARAVGFPFSPGVVVAASLLCAALFFLPAWRDWGFQVQRSSWCRAGVGAMVVYLGLCGVAHHAALKHVKQFAASHDLRVQRLAALPSPPSAAHWDGLIRTPEGVYEARINLLSGAAPEFRYVADTPESGCPTVAMQLPKVKTYLWFARFPVLRCIEHGDRSIVEISDLRFFSRRNRRSAPFAFRVTFDAAGHVIEQGWAVPEP